MNTPFDLAFAHARIAPCIAGLVTMLPWIPFGAVPEALAQSTTIAVLRIQPTTTNTVMVSWSTNTPPSSILLSALRPFTDTGISSLPPYTVQCDESPIDGGVICFTLGWDRVTEPVIINPEGRFQVIVPVRMASQFFRLEVPGVLESQSWAATMLEGSAVNLQPPPTLNFATGMQQVYGHGAANDFQGVLDSTGSGSIRISSLSFTRRFASPELLALDSSLARVLGKANRYQITSSTLELYQGSILLGRFVSVPKQSP